MPTIRKLFLLKLVIALALAAGLMAGVHTIQAGRIPDALLAHADRAAEADSPDQAIHYLRQYLEFRPDDTDAKERLAGMLKARPAANLDALILLYQQILRADPSRHAVRRDALAACLRRHRYADALSHGTELADAFPADAVVWWQLAAAQAALQKPDEAKQSYEAAIKADPADPLGYQRLIDYLWVDLKQPAEARAVLERLVTAAPHDAEAYLARARFEQIEGDPARAFADVRTALEIDPDHPDGLLMLADHYQKTRQPALARDCLADGVRLYPRHVRLIRGLAWLDLNLGNLGAAVAVLEAGMEKAANGFELLLPLADLLVQLGETGRTEAIVRKLEANPRPDAKMQARYLKARLAMRAADWPGAIALLTALRGEAVGMPGLETQTNLLLAACHQRRADTPAEQETLKLLLTHDPNHLAARVGLAQSYLAAGKLDDAVAEYEAAARHPAASFGTHATLLKLKARGLRWAKGSPADWQALDKAAAAIAPLASPGSADAAMLRADLASARGDARPAAAILRTEAARRPADARLWAAVADAVAKVAGVSAALAILDEGQAAAGDGPDLRLARADLYGRDPARLRPIDQLAGAADGWPDADQTRLLYGLVEVFDRAGDDAKVLETYQRIAARRPADVGVWEAVGERAVAAGDAKALASAKATLAKLDPAGKSVALVDAWAAGKAAAPDQARPAADALVQMYGAEPDRADVCVALGKLKQISGDRATASALFDRATRLEPSRLPPMQAHLAAVATAGQAEKLSGLMTRLAADPRWAGEAFRRAVRGAVRQAPVAGPALLAAARPFVESEPDGLGWLGEGYLALGRPQEAGDYFGRAADAPTATADDILRLAIHVGKTDRAAAAAVMASAQKRMPGPLYFATAASFADTPAAPVGWTPEFTTPADGRLYTQSRLALTLSRYRRSDGIALLQQFLAGQPTPADVTWAKRNLAMLLAVRAGPGDRQQAMTLLTSVDDTAGQTADEKRSTAAVLTALSKHLDGADRQAVIDRAIRALEDLVKETQSPRDGYLLAQVYRAAGQREASTRVLNGLLQADKRSLAFHVMGLEEAAELDDLATAQAFADRLIMLHPTDFRAIASVARFECRAGRADRALVLAESYLRTADPAAGDLPAKSARVAELLDELARRPKVRGTPAGQAMIRSAIARYESLLTARPEAVVAVAGLLGLDGRPADGFAAIDKQPTLPSRLKAAAGLAVLRTPGATGQQFMQVREWLDAAKAEEPDAVPLKLFDGEFYALRQDFPAAERAYEAALAQDPRNVVALNNLAWILAPRPDAAARATALVDRAVAELGLTGELLDTRARIRIAAKQYELAERDLTEALAQEKTPLRLFHMALSKQGQTPPRPDEADRAFKQAKERGLDPKTVHPADLPQYRTLDAARTGG